MRKRLAILAACAACASLRAVEGQSLADAARRAEEGRKTTTATTVLNMRDVDSALARQELLGIQIDPGAAPGASSVLQPGAVIADFRFVDFNGFTRSFSEFRGKYVMLSFWGTWCPYCRAEIHFANDAYARFQSRGFEILGMNYEKRATVEDVRRFIRSNSISWTVARPDSVDTLITERFGVRSYPTIVLFDPEGRVLPVRKSALRGEALAATLDRILPK